MTRRHRVRRATSRAGVIMAVMLATTSGCAARDFGIPAPDARRAPKPPTFVTPPPDPADDPQLAALTLPEDRPGAGTELSFADEARKRFDLLDTLLGVLQAKLGNDLSVARIDLRYPTTVTVRTPDGDDEYHIGDDDGVLYRKVLQGELIGGPVKAFRLRDIDVAAVARLTQGIGRRLALSMAPDITLSDPEAEYESQPESGELAWRISLRRGGASALVVAAPDGSVSRVET